MNKVFELYIANALRDEERYAVLDLPATPYEMLDALERAGCRSSEEAYYQVEEYLDFEYLESVISPDCSLNHLNVLAEKLSELNDRQSITFEGLLRMEQEKNEGQISIHTLPLPILHPERRRKMKRKPDFRQGAATPSKYRPCRTAIPSCWSKPSLCRRIQTPRRSSRKG